MRYEDFRREYMAGGLQQATLDACPIKQFEQWFAQASKSELIDPTAMVLGCVDPAGLPSQRIVLLKGISQGGFVFYTNYESNKALAIAHHPFVSAHFPWNALDRQVIVRAAVAKVSREESAQYFASRPRESQIAAWASQQSRAIASRAELESVAAALSKKFEGRDIPVPDFWGGYRLTPDRVEFWQGGEHRLHDRFVYTRQGEVWEIERLQP